MSSIKKISLTIIASCSLLVNHYAFANNWVMNMTPGVTEISNSIYNLHMLIFGVCVVIGIGVFSVLIYSLINHRKSKGAVPATFHSHDALEIVWAIIPFLILVAMAIPATTVLMAMEDTSDSDVTIRITGYQWKWQYEYLDENISFFSNLSTPPEQIYGSEKKNPWYLLEVDKPLVIPINKKVRFLLTSNDVIHAWWVPALGIKRDALPGFINETWTRIEKPGTYRGQCAELCGVNHGYMPIVVQAVSEEVFDKWIHEQKASAEQAKLAAQKTWTMESLMKLGKSAYAKYCAVCHKADGSGALPYYPPLKASSIAVGKDISRHIDVVLHGVENTAMQAFAEQLEDSEIAAIVTYERNAWGNNTGDVVQPSAVTARRKK